MTNGSFPYHKPRFFIQAQVVFNFFRFYKRVNVFELDHLFCNYNRFFKSDGEEF